MTGHRKFSDLRRRQGWRVRLLVRWYRVKWGLAARLGLCRHPGIVGPVGAEEGFCLYCKRDVPW